MYTFSEKRPRAVASAREISYDRDKGGDGVIEILEQTPGLVVCIKPVGVHAQGEAEADLPALLPSAPSVAVQRQKHNNCLYYSQTRPLSQP